MANKKGPPRISASDKLSFGWKDLDPLYQALRKWLQNTELDNPDSLAILLAIASVNGYGWFLSEKASQRQDISSHLKQTNNLLNPLVRCDPNDPSVVQIQDSEGDLCLRTYVSREEGINHFMNYLTSKGYLLKIAQGERNLSHLTKPLYFDPLINTNGPWDDGDLSKFHVRIASAYLDAFKNIAPPGLNPTWNTSLFQQGYQYYKREAYLQGTRYLPPNPIERVYVAADMLSHEWPWDQLPLANAIEAQTAIQGVLAITYLFGDFGKLNQTETNNWFQLGSPRVNNEPCGEMRTLNTLLQRCVWIYPYAIEGAQAALSAIVMSPNVKEQLLSGDLGKLAHAVLKDGFFAPTVPTKEIWVEAARILGVAVTDIVSMSGDTPRWKITDFVPTEFIDTVPNPNPCKEDEELVAGQCEKKQTPNVIDTTNLSHEDTEKKSHLGWWLLGAGIALGAGGWWLISSDKKLAA